MSGGIVESPTAELPKIHDIFDNHVEVWKGYPLTKRAVLSRPTMYLRERCKTAELFQELHNLVLAGDKQRNFDARDFANAVAHLSGKMQRWYQHLPFELQYEWPMSVAVWELQLVCRLICFIHSRC